MKKKIPKDCKPCKRFYKKLNRTTIEALKEAELWDYTSKRNFIRKWGRFNILTNYPSEIKDVNANRRKTKDGKYTNRNHYYWG